MASNTASTSNTASSSKGVKPLYTSILDDLKTLHIKDPIVNRYKSRTAYITQNKNTDDRAGYQFADVSEARLRCPYGISEPLEPKETDRKTLDITIENDSLRKTLMALDEHIIDVAHQNCVKWFGKTCSREVIADKYRSLVQESKKADKNYKPVVRTKVCVSAAADNRTRFFKVDDSGSNWNIEEVDYTIIGNGSRIIPVVELGSIWFSSTAFGLSLDATHILVFQTSQRSDFPFQIGPGIAVAAGGGGAHGSTSNAAPVSVPGSTQPSPMDVDGSTQPPSGTAPSGTAPTTKYTPPSGPAV